MVNFVHIKHKLSTFYLQGNNLLQRKKKEKQAMNYKFQHAVGADAFKNASEFTIRVLTKCYSTFDM